MVNMLIEKYDDEATESPRKKRKLLSPSEIKHQIKVELLPLKSERCLICRQYSDEVTFYNGHPNNAVDEIVTLTDERLLLFTGEEANMHDHDERPVHKITYFSVYDKNGHLCPFDMGIIEANKLLYFSGYVKPVYDEDPSTTNGLATKDIGPINEWYISGFDGGEKAVVGFLTNFAEYYLQEPSPEYQPIMNCVSKKITLTKLVIEFLLDESWQCPDYEDLLRSLQAHGDPEINEETLMRHAQFVCDQVTSFDKTANTQEDLLITAPCMRTLVKMTGVTFQKRQTIRKISDKGIKKKKGGLWSKATTTTLVREVFESFFVDQIDTNKERDGKVERRKRCGVCEACQTPDCGTCTHCRDMLKFGGTGRTKQACQLRRCPNMEIETAEDDEDMEAEMAVDVKTENLRAVCSKRIIHEVEWTCEPYLEQNSRAYYYCAKVGNLMVNVGDYVMLQADKPSQPLYVAIVRKLWQDLMCPMFHAHLFCRATDTVLGETADPRELFLVDVCETCPLGSIIRKATVEYRKEPSNWAQIGGEDCLPPPLEDDGQTFYYSKRYDNEFSRFVDVIEEEPDEAVCHAVCNSCVRNSQKDRLEQARLRDGQIYWQDLVYKIGSGVFLEPDTFTLQKTETSDIHVETETVDQTLHTEYYRKPVDNNKGSNTDTSEPFCIGMIEDMMEKNEKIHIVVRRFYRPEDTRGGVFCTYPEDLNTVYWSEEVSKVSFNKVCGKCYLAFGDALNMTPQEWSKQGPYRFYFTKSYDHTAEKLNENVPLHAFKVGQIGKGKGKGKGKSNKDLEYYDIPPEWETIGRPLRSMDVFAGCGGLSEGLHQAGIAETLWGIEKEAPAAQAFKLNNPNAIVYTDDCNDLLSMVMEGEGGKSGSTRKLPHKGDVELLVGGPPCQGFSGMNRFNAGQYSLFKNSLIVSYLSYCDYYRPKYFILENVRNFVSFKRSMVLKLTLRCLLAIGYQVTFGVVQAGHYGVPQTRRRLIIMAAAPGYVLPKYPEPQHVFNKKGCQLAVPVHNYRYYTGVNWCESAPYRTITVRDAMTDLPAIRNGSNRKEMPYSDPPLCHYQRMMRENDTISLLRDHVCKQMAPLVAARMERIPLYPGADWRDLPNEAVHLSDGTFANVLRYPYRVKKQNESDLPRGVCSCATGKSCDPADRQFNTLIPWCLPHTADRHNNWAGLYGRLEWDGFFGTTVTNPEPMGKQGRVLHPEQHRVVSVRECARSQGFPDRYQFYGSILDKHRQVGNAVPPPLGLAIGREICKALARTGTIKPEKRDEDAPGISFG